MPEWTYLFIFVSTQPLACIAVVIEPQLIMSAKQRRDPCSGPPTTKRITGSTFRIFFHYKNRTMGFLAKKLGSLSKGVFGPRTGSEAFPLSISGAPNVNFRKISLRKTIWDLEFSEHFFVKFLACLPPSPRIFEHLKYGIISHF